MLPSSQKSANGVNMRAKPSQMALMPITYVVGISPPGLVGLLKAYTLYIMLNPGKSRG